jgi:hypothetical protein
MHSKKYQLKSTSTFTRFEFISEGPKGAIRKLIEFQETTNPEIYNLAFGDLNAETGEVDDLAISDNQDTDKVLLTVADSVYTFLNKFSGKFVYATGSTKARTRLYRMGITRFYDTIKKDFYIYGQIDENFVEFEIGSNYDGFLVQLKY